MTKTELKKKYQNNEIEAVATIYVTLNDYIEILEIEHGIEDSVLGIMNCWYGDSEYFKRKIYYTEKDAYFKLGNRKYYLSEALRTRV